jgi:hypothetical protein
MQTDIRSHSLLNIKRVVLGLAAIAAFSVLYFGARLFAHEFSIFGLQDETIHLIGHLTVYGALAIVVTKAIGNRFVLAWVITNAIATAEELHQQYVPGRVASFDDWTTNLLSITVFLAAAGWIAYLSESTAKKAAEHDPATSPE